MCTLKQSMHYADAQYLHASGMCVYAFLGACKKILWLHFTIQGYQTLLRDPVRTVGIDVTIDKINYSPAEDQCS